MAVEARRGCGYRKVGGLYLVSPPVGSVCDRLPLPLTVCPTCGGGIKQARGWTWVNLPALVEGVHPQCRDNFACPLCMAPERIGKAGLMWVGAKFYTPQSFQREAADLGISKRISAIPQGFKLGETWVLLAHPEGFTRGPACRCEHRDKQHTWNGACTLCDCQKFDNVLPGIFQVFKPTAIEKIITKTQSQDAELVEGLKKRGISAVVVPDDDPDHQGSAFDKNPQLVLEE